MALKNFVKHLSTLHVAGPRPNIFIFSTARSGTTWLAEMIATQDRFKIVNEPFNLRTPVVRDSLGTSRWEDLVDPSFRPTIARYMQAFIHGRDRDLRFRREVPFSDNWHFITRRILFKILFAGEDCISWFRDQFNGQVVLLLRHPLAVSVSRKEFPRIHSLMARPYAAHFTAAQMNYARRILSEGDPLQVAVLDWALQNSIPLRTIEPDWLVISYEELVLYPEAVIPVIAERLTLTAPDRMLTRIFTPSASTTKSDSQSQSLLTNPERIRTDRHALISKWRNRISSEQETRAFQTLETFGIDFYRFGSDVPAESYLLAPA